MIENINWYPGHMKKTRELIAENLKMVDLVIEVIDARIPISSRNPIIDDLVKNKKRIIILNKSDLSDDKENNAWADFFKLQGNLVMKLNCMSGSGVNQLFKLLNRLQEEKNEGQIRKKPLRMMIVGPPGPGSRCSSYPGPAPCPGPGESCSPPGPRWSAGRAPRGSCR